MGKKRLPEGQLVFSYGFGGEENRKTADFIESIEQRLEIEIDKNYETLPANRTTGLIPFLHFSPKNLPGVYFYPGYEKIREFFDYYKQGRIIIGEQPQCMAWKPYKELCRIFLN